jgi:hypothetical protein
MMRDHEPLDLPEGIENENELPHDGVMFSKRRKVRDPADYTSAEIPADVLERVTERQRNDPAFQAKLKVIRDYKRAYERPMP